MTIKSKIILTSLAALTFFITSAYSITLTGKNGGTVEVKETDSVQVNMIEVPQNEQWMVDRVLFQSPSLTEKDISRVEYSFGVYYGEINKSNVRTVILEGGGHFFRDLYLEDVIDIIIE